MTKKQFQREKTHAKKCKSDHKSCCGKLTSKLGLSALLFKLLFSSTKEIMTSEES